MGTLVGCANEKSGTEFDMHAHTKPKHIEATTKRPNVQQTTITIDEWRWTKEEEYHRVPSSTFEMGIKLDATNNNSISSEQQQYTQAQKRPSSSIAAAVVAATAAATSSYTIYPVWAAYVPLCYLALPFDAFTFSWLLTGVCFTHLYVAFYSCHWIPSIGERDIYETIERNNVRNQILLSLLLWFYSSFTSIETINVNLVQLLYCLNSFQLIYKVNESVLIRTEIVRKKWKESQSRRQ